MIKGRLIFFLAALFVIHFVKAQNVSVYATIDTSKMRIGEQANIDIYCRFNAAKDGPKIQWPDISDSITSKIEVVNASAIDTTFPDKTDPSRIYQHQRITVSVYDSGYFAIPGFTFVVNDDTLNTYTTNPLMLEVHTVPTDTSFAKIKDIKEPFDEPFNWKWYVSYIYWGAAALAIIAAIAFLVYYLNKRKKVVATGPPKPKVPAHITALAALNRIQDQAIWKNGLVKEYYSEISDAVRLYIEERFGVMALESTTEEIMTAFRTQVVDPESKDKLRQLLTLSDLVKFAKLGPVESEHIFTLKNAFEFVNGTKREEVQEPAPETTTSPGETSA